MVTGCTVQRADGLHGARRVVGQGGRHRTGRGGVQSAGPCQTFRSMVMNS